MFRRPSNNDEIAHDLVCVVEEELRGRLQGILLSPRRVRNRAVAGLADQLL
jgi:hypothetical protein